MVKFQARQHDAAGFVLGELGAVVVVHTAVLVALDGEGCARAAPVPGGGEINGLAADEVARVCAQRVQQVGQRGAGGGFAMRTCRHVDGALRQYVGSQNLGHAGVGQAQLQHTFDLGMLAPHRIADDHQRCVGGYVAGGVGHAQLHAHALKHGTDGRPGALVTAGDLHTMRLQYGSQRAHAGTCDGDEIGPVGQLGGQSHPQHVVRQIGHGFGACLVYRFCHLLITTSRRAAPPDTGRPERMESRCKR